MCSCPSAAHAKVTTTKTSIDVIMFRLSWSFGDTSACPKLWSHVRLEPELASSIPSLAHTC